MWLRVILGIIRTADSFDVCEFFFVSLQLFLFSSFSFSFFYSMRFTIVTLFQLLISGA